MALRLATGDIAAGGVVLKLKTRDFRLRTRSRSPIAPTQLATRLFEAGRALLAPEIDGTRFRLIGLGACDLRPAADADHADLLDASLSRQKAMARAIDAVRAKFGSEALVAASRSGDSANKTGRLTFPRSKISKRWVNQPGFVCGDKGWLKGVEASPGIQLLRLFKGFDGKWESDLAQRGPGGPNRVTPTFWHAGHPVPGRIPSRLRRKTITCVVGGGGT